MPDYLPRDCYTAAQIRRMFGRRDDKGRPTPLSREALRKWRIKGKIPFIRFSDTNIRYPIKLVDELIQKANTTLS